MRLRGEKESSSKNDNEYHGHPLLLALNEDQLMIKDDGLADCRRCGEKVSAPCLSSCVQDDCGFYIHKICADAPLDLYHPFHPNHRLVLMQNSPYSSGGWICDFCCKGGDRDKFFYHCSCGFDFHIKCALFTFNIAQNNLKEREHVAPKDSPVSLNEDGQLMSNIHGRGVVLPDCSWCQHPMVLLNEEQLIRFTSDQNTLVRCSMCMETTMSAPCFSCANYCGFYLHKVCAEAPLELHHPFHPNHPFIMQCAPFSSGDYYCDFCHEGIDKFFYHCSCRLDLHLKCALFTFNIARNNFKELEHVAPKDPLSLNEDGQLMSNIQSEVVLPDCSWCQHPMVLLNEEQLIRLTSDQNALVRCSMCSKTTLSAPTFVCANYCGFYLHKVCADAPLELHHPFHPDHPLIMQLAPFSSRVTEHSCYFCNERGNKFFYHCSCRLDFHIRCALLTFNIAQNNFKELEHVALQDPLISTENYGSRMCFACQEPLAKYTHFSPNSGFNLHKKCVELPLKLNHMCHLKHPLVLQFNSERLSCKICHAIQETGFIYGCSPCKFVIDIECATLPIIEDKSHQHPLLLRLNEKELIKYHRGAAKCEKCGEKVSAPFFRCIGNCEFYLHKVCVEAPLKLNHTCHRKHPLFLQVYGQLFSCKICQVTQDGGFVYGCSHCKFFIHIECVSPSPVIEDENHPHLFTLLLRQVPFICDACGTEGGHAAYTCGTCSIVIHKKCISLPRVIRSKWHDHRLFHTYCLHLEDFENMNCIICHDEVNTEHGSYYCSGCNVIFHVNCATKDEDSYVIVSPDDEDEVLYESSINILETNDAGEATVIEHCKHIGHHLMLSDRVGEHDYKCCDGCMLPISASFYQCSECDFFLHKVCAELAKVKHVWHHRCYQPLVLTSNEEFRCVKCDCFSNAFAYICEECGQYTCFRCVISLTPGARTYPGHKHPLLFYTDYTGLCNACGGGHKGMFRCKDCNFSLDHICFSLPITARYKCEEHLLSLAYHDDNSYSESHYCDICEGSRDPNPWFYRCATCDTSAHVSCVLGEFPFVKLGRIVEVGEDVHEHPLKAVKKIFYYPDCSDCGKPCVDLALECTKSGCNYITHNECPAISFTFSDSEDYGHYT